MYLDLKKMEGSFNPNYWHKMYELMNEKNKPKIGTINGSGSKPRDSLVK